MSKYKNNDHAQAKTNSHEKSNNQPRKHKPIIKKENRGGSKKGSTKRAIVSFDPSLFIKKVKEQPAALPSSYNAQHTFSDFLIDDRIKKNIEKKGYLTPTPIQDQAIPCILEGKDLIGTANTGTGKTAAFLIPLINNVLTQKIKKVLIITPTRELAAQIHSEFNDFARGTQLSSVVCIGGVAINGQIRNLKQNPEFVIGTPGRILDLEQNHALHLDNYQAIVLDEVDRMLDMGFIRSIRSIIAKLPTKRHSLFFSATISPDIKEIMHRFVVNPVTINVALRQSAELVNQDVIHVGQNSKIELLHDLLIKPEIVKVIVFTRTKWTTEKLAKALKERGFDVVAIHGNKTQPQRKKALDLFRTNKVKILLATDVVARGIDIDDITHVINFDMPQTHEDYIHRIGRTGRANKVGQAITFVD